MREIACPLLADRAGALLRQLPDGHAPYHPNVWGLPGGTVEPGETPAEGAVRELWEKAALRPSPAT